MLKVQTYHVTCDVPGCEQEGLATPASIAAQGWKVMLYTGGKPSLIEWPAQPPYYASCVCPACSRETPDTISKKLQGLLA